MNKKYFSHGLFIGVILFLMTAAGVAQGSEMGSNATLESSLKRLRESVDEVKKENEMFALKIDIFRNKIKASQEELKSLEEQKQDISMREVTDDPVVDQSKEKALLDQKTQRFQKEILALEAQVIQWEADLNVAKKKNHEAEAQVTALSSETKALKEKLQSINALLEKKESQGEEKELSRSINEGQKRLGKSKKQHDKLKKKVTKPVQRIKELEKQEKLLKQRLTIRGDEYQVALEEEKEKRADIKKIEDQNKEIISELDKEIEKLRERRKELDSILLNAKKKFEGNFFVSEENDVHEEDRQLKKNLDFIVNENRTLQEEFDKLQKELEALESL